MDGRLFVRFPIDVVVSSLILEPIEKLKGHDWMDFAGIKAASFDTISPEQQFAEKFHAYTLPRKGEENSRVKDLIDMLLLIRSKGLEKSILDTAIKKVFEYRKTHPVPSSIDAPPPSWEDVFNELAKTCELKVTLPAAFQEISEYMHLPVIKSSLK